MAGHLARRIGQYLLVLVVLVMLNFLIPRLAPGDPIDFLLPPEVASGVTEEQRERVMARFGFDDPVHVQFWNYANGVARGDFLTSVRYGRPVTEVVLERLPWTLLIVLSAVLVSTVVGTVAGFRSAWRRGRATDVGTLSFVMFLDSLPPFFVGLLLILVFSVWLGLFPVFGALPSVPSTGVAFFADVAIRAALPTATLTIAALGFIYLTARSAMVSELGEDYVMVASAKGLPDGAIRRHAQRNALLPVWTAAMLNVAVLSGATTVVETVFAYPGLGRLVYDAVIARDYPVLQGAFFFLALMVLAANIIADLAYPLLDPRVRRPRPAS
ncbi:MAG TPA: ABC transporter permease [Egibacteraceae bacterium]|nr:ABC transporter permease [Egibacteraceae bacterium]